jgi:ectoine hydroxylase-related dioxygenase (phytanoyl-CoA dioxygenase family)
MMMSMLWGTYINDLPRGNMGNLLVYPGTHHTLADHLRKKGPNWMYDGKKEKAPPQSKWPNLARAGLSDGQAYQLCVEKGDIVFAHPWLAHGIGVNTSNQARLACYARLSAKEFWWPPNKCFRMQIAGHSLGEKPWEKPYVSRWKGTFAASGQASPADACSPSRSYF